MIIEGTYEKYKAFLKQLKKEYCFSDEILYGMCEKEPKHEDEDIITGKICLIGRTYAAAIERRKKSDDYQGDDFYKDKVGPEMMKVGKELDNLLDKLRKSKGLISDNINEILDTHSFLMKVFKKITHMEKRSLASKYLHFHCREKFFIYDSRACSAIRKVVRKPYNEPRIDGFDPPYVDFVCKMLELQKYLLKKGCSLKETTPRKLDRFLLESVTNN